MQLNSNKLNGLYQDKTGTGNYAKVKTYIANKEYKVDPSVVSPLTDVTLPTDKKKYIYVETPNGSDTDITIYK